MSDMDLMYMAANGIANGKAGVDFIYHMAEEDFYFYKSGCWRQLSHIEIMSIILKHYNGDNNTMDIRRFTVGRRAQILENLKFLVFKRLEDFNKTGFLNFDIGEFDPITMTMHDHNKENYSTLRMPYPYHHSAKCELWDNTLLGIFENNQDKIDLLQEFFGYCLTRDTKQRKALLLIGQSNCGKSTILWTLRNMIGEQNCSDVSVNFINNPQYTSEMMNKLVNFDTDVSQDAKGYEEQFKKVAGGEPVNCSPKYIPTFKFFPYCKQAFGSNGFPRVTDHSDAFFNRLLIIPCNRIYEEEQQNKNLKEQLTVELSGIFNWAVEGLQRLNARGHFEIKEFMKEAKEELRDESNPIDVFFRETIEVDKEGKEYILKGELYNKYTDWCKSNSNIPMSGIKFGKAVLQKYNKITEKNSQNSEGVRIWRNLKFKDNRPKQENLAWQD